MQPVYEHGCLTQPKWQWVVTRGTSLPVCVNVWRLRREGRSNCLSQCSHWCIRLCRRRPLTSISFSVHSVDRRIVSNCARFPLPCTAPGVVSSLSFSANWLVRIEEPRFLEIYGVDWPIWSLIENASFGRPCGDRIAEPFALTFGDPDAVLVKLSSKIRLIPGGFDATAGVDVASIFDMFSGFGSFPFWNEMESEKVFKFQGLCRSQKDKVCHFVLTFVLLWTRRSM